MVIDRIAAQYNVALRKRLFRSYQYAECGEGEHKLHLVKPLTYMNRSGEILDRVIARSRCGLSQTLVVCDNLDLPVGTCRLKTGGSSAGHNGLASIIQYAGSPEFQRLYVGIGRPSGGGIIEHVLGVPNRIEETGFAESLDAAATAVLSLLDQPIERVMNELNKRK